jgi:hypothetical protein
MKKWWRQLGSSSIEIYLIQPYFSKLYSIV